MKSYENELLKSRPTTHLNREMPQKASNNRYSNRYDEQLHKYPFNDNNPLWSEYLCARSGNKLETEKDDDVDEAINTSLMANGTKNGFRSPNHHLDYEDDKDICENDEIDEKENILNAAISENYEKPISNKGSTYSKHSSVSECSKRSMTFYEGETERITSEFMDETFDATMMEDHHHHHHHHYAADERGNANFVMFMGMSFGMFLTKSFGWMDVYLSWLQKQVLKMANVFLKGKTPGEFFNLEDDVYYSPRSKLILAPLLALLALFYGLLYGMQCFFKFLLAPTPAWLMSMVDKEYT